MEQEFSLWFPTYGSGDSFIYLLFFVLLLLSIICFLFSKYDILYPPLIGTISFTCCVGLAALYTNLWNLPMHFNTAIIIICMVSLFIGGGFIATNSIYKLIAKKQNTNKTIYTIDKAINITFKYLLLIILLLLFSLYYNYKEFIVLASQVTDSHNFSEMLFPVTNGVAQGIIKFSKLFSYRLLFAKSISYTSVIFFWYNFAEKKYFNCLKWSILTVLYFPFILLTAGRQLFLYFILFSLISLIMILRKRSIIQKGLKEIYIVLVAFLGFLLFFLGTGLLNGKINANLGLFRVLVHYAGVNISGFDVYINEMIIPDTPYIGLHTLSPITFFLNHFGLNYPDGIGYIPLFTVFGSVSTNVYTALFRYIIDFGFIGCGIIMFLLGFGYTFFYEYIAIKNYKSWMVMLYAFISYPIFLLGREERFLNEIFTTRTGYTFLMMMLFYKFVNAVNQERGK